MAGISSGPGGGSTIIPSTLNVQSRQEQQVAAGWVFMGGTAGGMTLSLNSNLRIALTNPAGSPRTAFVFGIFAYSAVLAFARLYMNPTSGVPTTPVTPTNMLVGSANASACSLYVDTNATAVTGGGTSLYYPLPPTELAQVSGPPIIVPQGNTLALNVPAPVINSALGLYLGYYEQ